MSPTTLHSPEDYTTSPLLCMLVTLGRSLLKNPTKSKWMNVEELCAICKKRNIHLNGTSPRPHELEHPIISLFEHNDEICCGGINITSQLKRQGWDRVFVVGFFPDIRSTISQHGERKSDLKDNHTTTQTTGALIVK